MDRNTWVSIASLSFTLLFGLIGWITMNGMIDFINGLNPWKVSFFSFLIIFLGSLFITIRDKYRDFRKDYQETRKIVYQLFGESEAKKIKNVVESAIHEGFIEAKKDLVKK
jgi:hypothetical protein